jgi:hypothetical protein
MDSVDLDNVPVGTIRDDGTAVLYFSPTLAQKVTNEDGEIVIGIPPAILAELAQESLRRIVSNSMFHGAGFADILNLLSSGDASLRANGIPTEDSSEPESSINPDTDNPPTGYYL